MGWPNADVDTTDMDADTDSPLAYAPFRAQALGSWWPHPPGVGANSGYAFKDKTVGPRIKIYNASNTLADAVFDATITGI